MDHIQQQKGYPSETNKSLLLILLPTECKSQAPYKKVLFAILMCELYLARAGLVASFATLQLICEIEAVLLNRGPENGSSTSNHNESTVTQINSMQSLNQEKKLISNVNFPFI